VVVCGGGSARKAKEEKADKKRRKRFQEGGEATRPQVSGGSWVQNRILQKAVDFCLQAQKCGGGNETSGFYTQTIRGKKKSPSIQPALPGQIGLNQGRVIRRPDQPVPATGPRTSKNRRRKSVAESVREQELEGKSDLDRRKYS